MKIQIIKTNDGSTTFFVPELNEHYHSVNGAITESRYVFLEKGFHFHPKKNNISVLEIGFGTGLNCWLTSLSAFQQKRNTFYFAVEKAPIKTEDLSLLNYTQQIPDPLNFFKKIHQCEWEKEIKIHDYFQLVKIKTDLTLNKFAYQGNIDLIYFDAFGPDKQPEMWTSEIFKSLSDCSNPNAVFVTYSAKGEVRRKLIDVGFTMERLPGPPGKKQMLRGIKNTTNL